MENAPNALKLMLMLFCIYICLRALGYVWKRGALVNKHRGNINYYLKRLDSNLEMDMDENLPGDFRSGAAFGMIFDKKNKKIINQSRPSHDYIKDLV